MQPKQSIGDCDRQSIKELRALVEEHLTPYYDTEFNLLRWLQGHPGKVEAVAQKLTLHLKMRSSSWKLDTLAASPRNHPIHNHWRYGVTGKAGVLKNVIVNIEQCGGTDYWGMMQTFSLAEVMRARIPDLENMLRHVMDLENETGKQSSILYVMDLSGLKIDKRLYKLIVGPLKSLAEFMAEHYVELIKYFVLVNVPSYICAILTVALPLLPERTREKVRFLSSHNWRQEILDFASADVLPAHWNLPGETVFTGTISLPVQYSEAKFYCGQKRPDAIEMHIRAGRVSRIVKRLREGEELTWWLSGDGDFGMGIYYSAMDGDLEPSDMDTVYPCFPWMPGPTVVPLEDSIVAEKEGYYVMWISNSRAWWHTLTISYVIAIA